MSSTPSSRRRTTPCVVCIESDGIVGNFDARQQLSAFTEAPTTTAWMAFGAALRMTECAVVLFEASRSARTQPSADAKLSGGAWQIPLSNGPPATAEVLSTPGTTRCPSPAAARRRKSPGSTATAMSVASSPIRPVRGRSWDSLRRWAHAPVCASSRMSRLAIEQCGTRSGGKS